MRTFTDVQQLVRLYPWRTASQRPFEGRDRLPGIITALKEVREEVARTVSGLRVGTSTEAFGEQFDPKLLDMTVEIIPRSHVSCSDFCTAPSYQISLQCQTMCDGPKHNTANSRIAAFPSIPGASRLFLGLHHQSDNIPSTQKLPV